MSTGRRPRRATLFGLALLTAGVSPAASETLLDAVLYVASGLDAEDIGKRKVTVTQDGQSLDAKLFLWTIGPGNPGKLENLYSVSLRRITNCRFEVGFGGGLIRRLATYHVDFSGADFADIYFKDVPNHAESHSLVIPGAIWCRVDGYKVGEPSCTSSPAVLGALGRHHDDKMLAAIRRLEKVCPVKVSLLHEPMR